MVFGSMLSLDETCSVPGCDLPVFAKGLCEKHYRRLQRKGHVDNSLVRKMCPSCHRWFQPTRSDQIFDCHACRTAWYEQRKVIPSLPKRPQVTPYVKRPASEPVKRRPIKVVPFTRTQVFEKCHGLCAVCHKPVDRDYPMGYPDSPVYAWRVPPARCGYATLSNRVIVHQKCLSKLKGGKR